MPVTELNIRFANPNNVIVRFGDDDTETLPFQSPLHKIDFEEMAWYLENYASRYMTDVDDQRAEKFAARLKELGKQLFNSIFSDAAARRLFNSFQDSEGIRRLITISAEHPAILALPWELLCETTFLMHEKISIRRRFSGVGRGRKAFKIEAKDHLHLLFVVSRPAGAGFLDPRSEAQAVMQAVQQKQANISFEFLRPATLDGLVKRLENENLPPIDILHFDGHGIFSAAEIQENAPAAKHPESGLTKKQGCLDGNTGYLLFENDEGEQDLVDAETLGDALFRKKIALVVLSACQSATVGGEDALSSVAARLTDAGLPAVLAMTYSVLVATTEKLFAEFYAELMHGKNIGAALDSARRYLSRHPERGERQREQQRIGLDLQDWFVPALYQSNSDAALLNKSAAPVQQKTEAKSHNLPQRQEAGFFGRSRELWQIERDFVQGTRRITITGFGGQGKTYLAVEAGLWALQTGQFERVCFVDYAAFQGVDAVGTVLSTLGTVVGQSLPDSQAATVVLQQTATLLILDNLESLNAAALNELLTAAQPWSEAGDSRLLLTTRSPNLPNVVYPKEGSRKHRYLPLRGLGQEDTLAYFQTLQKLPPEPQFKQPAREVLLHLFAEVDFHPLSIALLARELKFRRPAELGERLQALLNEIPPGHENKTLLASLQLSLDRLDQQARLLLKSLGVFQAGALEHMILAITGISAEQWASSRPALVNTGLIQVEDLSYLGVAFPYVKFHPTLAPALWQELNQEHQLALAAHYRQSYYELSGFLFQEDKKNPSAARAKALRELPNLLHAVYAVFQAGEDFALDFANRVNLFLTVFGLMRDRASLNEMAQQAGSDIGSVDWFLVRFNHGEQLFDTGEYQQAIAVFEEILRQLPETAIYRCCLTLNKIGLCFSRLGNTAEAIDCYQQGLILIGQLENSTALQRQISLLHSNLATAFRDSGDYNEAENYYLQALSITKKINDTQNEAVYLLQLGTLAMVQGDLKLAVQRYQSAMHIIQILNRPKDEAIVWHQLGYIYSEMRSWARAEQSYRESARIKEALGDLKGAARTWHNLAGIVKLQGKLDAAESWYRKVIPVIGQCNQKDLACCLNNLANLLQHQTLRVSEARTLADEALAIKKTLDEAGAEIWKTYGLLAQIADKQQDIDAAKSYRKLSRDSYLRFAGMPYRMQQHERLIAAVVQALTSQATDLQGKASPLPGKPAATKEVLVLKELLTQFPEEGQNLVTAIEQLLNGKRNPEVLLEPLDFTDAAIVHCILKALD